MTVQAPAPLSSATLCTLCQVTLSIPEESENGLPFCCQGCLTVYRLLKAKDVKGDFREDPFFLQALKNGIIQNQPSKPLMHESSSQDVPPEVERVYVEVQNMWCLSCADFISLSLRQIKGVVNARIDYTTDLGVIDYAPRYLSQETLLKRIQSWGYRTHLFNQEDPQEAKKSSAFSRMVIALFCALNIMMFSYPIYAGYFDFDSEEYAQRFAWLSWFFSLPLITYCFAPILKNFLLGIRHGHLKTESLAFIGVSASFGLSTYALLRHSSPHIYLDSMAVIIAFLWVAKWIEEKAKIATKESLFHFIQALPRRGRKRFSDGSQHFTPLKDIQKGDIMLAYTGEKIVLDGVVIEGEGNCDESLMTGETLPLQKSIGERVLGGTYVVQGWMAYKVTCEPNQSALHSILAISQQEFSKKPAVSGLTDSISRFFVPFVLLFTFLTMTFCVYFSLKDADKSIWETAAFRGISILLIACPCALGIAIPLAESLLIQRLATMGALVRRRSCLPFFGRESLYVFDKTGTLTTGKLQVLRGVKTLSIEEKAILKSMVSTSIHPISKAVDKFLQADLVKLAHVKEFPGEGIEALYNEQRYLLGSRAFLQKKGIKMTQKDDNDNKLILTEAYFATEERVISKLLFTDNLREGALDTLTQLSKKIPLWLLSGDQERNVQVMAAGVGIKDWKASCKPEEKLALIQSFKQRHIVGMVGDGMNDCAAIASAHVGISFMSATDISLHASDIVLTTERLDVLPRMRALSRQGYRLARQNIFWAFFYNIIGLGLAATGLLTPLFAAFAMTASSLMILYNSQRLR